MTPFRNDLENPFARERVWPAMPQTPLRPARGRTVLGLAMGEPETPQAGRAPQSRHRRRGLRLTPLIGAAMVGVGGLLTLFLLIGGAAPQP